ncbi:MAG: 4Fe-4S dicluster domain-containing protein [Bacteroidota bacterium]
MRVAVSLVFFLLYLFLFIDIAGFFSQELMNVFTTLQFFPSLLSFAYSHEPETLAGFILVLILTFFFGRIYCSTLCPLGTMQDIILFVKRKIFRKKKFKLKKSMLWLGYSFAFLLCFQLFLGGNIIANLTEPFSLFGKITLGMISPVYVFANNLLAGWLNESGNYLFLQFDARPFSGELFVFSLLFLLFFVVLNYFAGRFWCASLCPAGSTLGFISKFSVFKIRIKEDACNHCNSCVRVCKSGCIDQKNFHVDMRRCILCFNCLQSCPEQGMVYSRNKTNTKSIPILNSQGNARREFFMSSSLAGFGIAGTLMNHKLKVESSRSKLPVSPPGSIGVHRFADRCTACHQCVSQCPSGVLRPTLLEYGVTGMMIPKMDFTRSFCNYECSLCSQICPTRALLPLDNAEKKKTQIGIAIFEEKLCVVVTEGTDCGACAEHCPTGAIEMINYKNGVLIPKVADEFCVGCGACEHACPVRPVRSIIIKSNETHLTAELQESKAENKKIDYKVDFPF